MIFGDSSQSSLIDDGGFNWKTGEREAPLSNTGAVVVSKDFDVSVGWVTMSFRVDSFDNLLPLVGLVGNTYCCHLMDELVDTQGSFRGYKNVRRFALGAIIAYTELRNDFILVLPQSTVECINLPYLLLLIKDLLTVDGARITRLDLTIDDLRKSIRISDFSQSYQAGCMVARTKAARDVVEYSAPGIKSQDMFTIGKRSSQFYVRIYDKELESKGKSNAIRFEAELKDDLAHYTILKLVSTSFSLSPVFSVDLSDPISSFSFQAFVNTVLGVISSKLDFRDVTSHSNVNRRTRLVFWEKFLQGVQKVKVFIPRKKATIETVKLWFEEKVSTSLALLNEYLGSEASLYFSSVLDYGYSRFKPRHTAILANALA